MTQTTHLLLDIEGTTCPISFVSSVLFPYAKKQLDPYLILHGHNKEVQTVITEAWQEWRIDQDETSQKLLQQSPAEEEDTAHQAISNYFQHLISIDRKSTSLKDLQGRIWEQGYRDRALQTELFPEALQALRSWRRTDLKLAVYSSGSINAQKLLYQYTPEGDIRDLFCAWFDTHTGPKKASGSYINIAKQLGIRSKQITFISDNKAECDAAEEAGLRTLFSLRDNNPDQNPGQHCVIRSLSEVLSQLQLSN
ncbi:acireductone synthase [Synechococcus sp. UW140]|uniref:acireductone synthase n=1 Tax=Synechococcus sp. UW140 TaxID=368503 RepID=UPI000E0E4BB0|nr:acireductone synthase [Synechococcus sp. UW140]